MIGFLVNAMGIIKSQYVNIPNQHIVYLKLIQNLLFKSCPALCDPMNCSHLLLQGIYLTRDRTWISYIAGRFFTTELPGSSNYTELHVSYISIKLGNKPKIIALRQRYQVKTFKECQMLIRGKFTGQT